MNLRCLPERAESEFAVPERVLCDGYFMPPGHNGFASIDALEPHALLYLESSRRGQLDQIPVYVGSGGYTQGDYLGEDGMCWDVVEGSLY